MVENFNGKPYSVGLLKTASGAVHVCTNHIDHNSGWGRYATASDCGNVTLVNCRPAEGDQWSGDLIHMEKAKKDWAGIPPANICEDCLKSVLSPENIPWYER